VNLDAYRTYCLSKPGVTEGFPFGEDVLVFKVGGKMFALSRIDPFERISLKVVPERGAELREAYEAVQAAYHMNKLHWIMVMMDGTIPDKYLKAWIDDSYTLVVASLSKKDQAKLAGKGASNSRKS
jgi:predicted DNA-binding protein (MmcQ/YjbR family)